MILFRYILLFLLCQLSFLPFAYPNRGKSFPIYNLIATKINEYTAGELLQYGQVHSDLWPEYKTANPSRDDYLSFSLIMENLIEAVKKLEEDNKNCHLQKDVMTNMRKLYQTNSAIKWRAYEKYISRENQMKTTNARSLLRILYEIFELLPHAINSFLGSLNDRDKEVHQKLLQWCKLFLAATSNLEKYYFFSAILSLYPEKLIEKTTKDCIWDVSAMQAFNQKAVVYILGK